MKFKSLGPHFAKYALGILQGGPMGALGVASELQDTKEKRKHQLKIAGKMGRYGSVDYGDTTDYVREWQKHWNKEDPYKIEDQERLKNIYKIINGLPLA